MLRWGMPIQIVDANTEQRASYSTIPPQYCKQQTFYTELTQFNGLSKLDQSPVSDAMIWGEIPDVDLMPLIEISKHVIPLTVERNGNTYFCTAFPSGINVEMDGLPYDVIKTAGHCLPNQSDLFMTSGGVRIGTRDGQEFPINSYSVQIPNLDIEMMLVPGVTYATSPFTIQSGITPEVLEYLATNPVNFYQIAFPNVSEGQVRIQKVSITSFNDLQIFFAPTEESLKAGFSGANEGGGSGGPIGYLVDGKFYVLGITKGINSEGQIVSYIAVDPNNLVEIMNAPDTSIINLNWGQTPSVDNLQDGEMVYTGDFNISMIGAELSKYLPQEFVEKALELIGIRELTRTQTDNNNPTEILIHASRLEIDVKDSQGTWYTLYLQYNSDSGEAEARIVEDNSGS